MFKFIQDYIGAYKMVFNAVSTHPRVAVKNFCINIQHPIQTVRMYRNLGIPLPLLVFDVLFWSSVIALIIWLF